MTKGIVICLTAWMFVAAVTVTTAAQSNALGPNTQELRQQLNELQAQMNKVQARLDQLENEKVTGTPHKSQSPLRPAEKSDPSSDRAGRR